MCLPVPMTCWLNENQSHTVCTWAQDRRTADFSMAQPCVPASRQGISLSGLGSGCTLMYNDHLHFQFDELWCFYRGC
jgi:hypothetical protein